MLIIIKMSVIRENLSSIVYIILIAIILIIFFNFNPETDFKNNQNKLTGYSINEESSSGFYYLIIIITITLIIITSYNLFKSIKNN